MDVFGMSKTYGGAEPLPDDAVKTPTEEPKKPYRMTKAHRKKLSIAQRKRYANHKNPHLLKARARRAERIKHAEGEIAYWEGVLDALRSKEMR